MITSRTSSTYLPSSNVLIVSSSSKQVSCSNSLFFSFNSLAHDSIAALCSFSKSISLACVLFCFFICDTFFCKPIFCCFSCSTSLLACSHFSLTPESSIEILHFSTSSSEILDLRSLIFECALFCLLFTFLGVYDASFSWISFSFSDCSLNCSCKPLRSCSKASLSCLRFAATPAILFVIVRMCSTFEKYSYSKAAWSSIKASFSSISLSLKLIILLTDLFSPLFSSLSSAIFFDFGVSVSLTIGAFEPGKWNKLCFSNSSSSFFLFLPSFWTFFIKSLHDFFRFWVVTPLKYLCSSGGVKAVIHWSIWLTESLCFQSSRIRALVKDSLSKGCRSRFFRAATSKPFLAQ